jgi:hypothetical protein
MADLLATLLDPDGPPVLTADPAAATAAIAALDPAGSRLLRAAPGVPLWATHLPHSAPASRLEAAQNLLHARENRQAYWEGAVRRLAAAAPRLVVAMPAGRVRVEDIGFLRDCARRVRHNGRPARVVLLRAGTLQRGGVPAPDALRPGALDLSAAACAVAAERPHTLLAAARAAEPAIRLAALVAAYRHSITPVGARRVLSAAERTDVAPSVRSLLAYHLGQALAKGAHPAASLPLFDYARASVPAPDGAGASRVAASHNGEALARYRVGDQAGAARAEQAALTALTGLAADSAQHCLLLTNLADVYGRAPATAERAVACRVQAVRTATTLPALSYAVPKLVKALLSDGSHDHAEHYAGELLRAHDADPAPRRADERAAVSVCSALADAARRRGAPADAASWLAEAASRMRRATPDALAAVLRALPPEADPAVAARVRAEIATATQVHRHAAAFTGLAAGARS